MTTPRPTRRSFLGHGAATLATAAAPGVLGVPSLARSRPGTNLRVLSIGVIGTIGGTDRTNIAAHPEADIVGLCDIDAQALATAAADHPQAFTCKDYREAFASRGDEFDAVIVATPDHSHCAIMTEALKANKHVYGQKPLVHQLEELELLKRAVDARPELVTQTGAQRIQSKARRAAVHILRSGELGKVIDVHIAFGTSAIHGGHYFSDGILGEPCDPPEGFDYDLWLNGAAYEPCRPQMVQRRWRSWFGYGGGQIADWVVHVTDVLFYAFPELKSPMRVCTRTPSRDLSFFHADRVTSTLTYAVDSPSFANTNCNFYFYDSGLQPDRAQLGIGEGEWPGGIFTIVVCEGGTLVLGPAGPIQLWRDGQMSDGLEWPDLPELEEFNHWHAWVDAALGKQTPNLWAPFDVGLKCTEPGLLAVKAAMYPGQVLDWDREALAFTNHAEATKTLVRRDYREGFEPVRFQA